MRFHGWSLSAALSLLAVVALPHLATAACPGVCDPIDDVCCTDECDYEDSGVACHPTNEPCRTKKCDGAGSCDQGSFKALANGAVCIGSDPCFLGECNGSAQCLNQDEPRCADGNDCTNDAPQCEVNGIGSFVQCDDTNMGVLVPNGTVCSSDTAGPCQAETCTDGACLISGDAPEGAACGALITGTTCAVKGCVSGQCTGTQVGSDVPCVDQDCSTRSCAIDEGVAVCVQTEVANGTPCDADPWDCTHQRCNSKGQCKDRRTTTLKECDADGATGAHCFLSFCTRNKTCRTGAEYEHYLGTNAGGGFWDVEGPETRGRSNIITQSVPTCSGNPAVCTVDKCDGMQQDSCSNSCEIGVPCPFPACGDVCDLVGTTCTCRDE